MIDGVSVAVVVPAHDVERWLGEVLATMPSFVDHVVVVDDGSRDGTAEIPAARRAVGRSRGPRITVLRHARRQGVGAAIAAGYRQACALRAEVVGVMAGDGQMHPGDLERVLAPVVAGRAAYVKGNRLAHPRVWALMPPGRLLGSLLLSWLTSLAAGVPVRDSQCGFTAVSAQALAQLDLDRLWPSFGYPNDLIGALAARGQRIAEVPVRPVYRGQASGLRPWHGLTIGFVIGRVGARRLLSAARKRAWRRGGSRCPRPA
jgi:glycosyltransferase involved in cell wall biosynthesis